MQTSDHRALHQLAKTPAYINGQFRSFVKDLLVTVCQTKKISRASLWLNHAAEGTFKNYSLYDKRHDSFRSADVFDKKKFPELFNYVISSYVLEVADVSKNKYLDELSETYLTPLNITGFLIIQIWNRGKLFGFLLLEMTDTVRNWSKEDKLFAAGAASYIGNALNNSLVRKEREEKEAVEYIVPDFNKIFDDMPIPVWLFEADSLDIVECNQLAADLYGYEMNVFRDLSVRDLIHESQLEELEKVASKGNKGSWEQREWIQKQKSDTVFLAHIATSWTTYCGKKVKIAVVINANREKKIEKEREELEQKLNDHAFYTSHNIRKPIANILGLIDLIKMDWDDRESYEDLLYRLKIQTMNLDETIRVMTAKIELD